MWKPITKDELLTEIYKTETDLTRDLWNFWQLIKIHPEKWAEENYGKEGNGFWVVGICGTKVIWYNDIEDGFNISNYKKHGKIEEYFCNQDELNWTITRLFSLLKNGGNLINQSGPPQPIK